LLSFEEKRAILKSYNLIEREISYERYVYDYPESRKRGKILAREIYHSGNGYVRGQYMSEEIIKNRRYEVDGQGWISIMDFSREQLNQVIVDAMESMCVSVAF
jgi:hypothetical protein